MQRIIRVPFIGSVNLHALLLRTGTSEHSHTEVSLVSHQIYSCRFGSTPNQVRKREQSRFSRCRKQPSNPEVPCRARKFSNGKVHSLVGYLMTNAFVPFMFSLSSRSQFSNLSSIALYFRAEDLDPVQIFYVGFLGHWNEVWLFKICFIRLISMTCSVQHKRAAIITIYESQANLADHGKIQGLDGTSSSLQP
jgi:hypothetical protein